jgi:hypothetical protein
VGSTYYLEGSSNAIDRSASHRKARRHRKQRITTTHCLKWQFITTQEQQNMIHTGYYHFAECPLTDEDLGIIRGLACRIGGTYYSIHQTEQGMQAEREAMASTQYARGKKQWGWRRDYCGKLQSMAKTHADVPTYEIVGSWYSTHKQEQQS